MDELIRTAGRHATDAPRGTAYDLVAQNRGTVWIRPDHHRHAAEAFTGDLSDNRDMQVSS